MKLILATLVLLYVLPLTYSSCSEYSFCDSCTKAKSWLSTCRWCPRDNKCHATGSLVNGCKSDENILNPLICPPIDQKTIYSEAISYQMLRYAKAAYHEFNDKPAPSFSPYFPKTAEIHMISVFPLDHGQSALAYLAVDKTNQRIVIAFRGSTGWFQIIDQVLESGGRAYPWIDDIPAPPGVTVMHYFLDAWIGVHNFIHNSIKETISKHPDFEIWITGHSLGGALASLEAFYLTRAGIVVNPTVYTFGQPRTGNYAYAKRFNELIPNSFRVVNNRDPVAHVPICIARDNPDNIVGLCGIRLTDWEPWHTSTEIFYGKGDYLNGFMCRYRECIYFPPGEDDTCSDRFINFPAEVFLPIITPEKVNILATWVIELLDQHRDYWDVLDRGFCGVSMQN